MMMIDPEAGVVAQVRRRLCNHLKGLTAAVQAASERMGREPTAKQLFASTRRTVVDLECEIKTRGRKEKQRAQ